MSALAEMMEQSQAANAQRLADRKEHQPGMHPTALNT
jgi:hypothetical protein